MKFKLAILPIFVFVLLCLFLLRGLFLNPHSLPSVQIGKRLPYFVIPQLLNTSQSFNSSKLPKQVMLLNVWASWCEACVEEQAFLMTLARQKVPIYALNYKDNPQKAKEWLVLWGNPYREIGQDKDGKVGMDLGVYGTPETFIIDKQGIIRYRHIGGITQTLWEHTLLPLMRQWE